MAAGISEWPTMDAWPDKHPILDSFHTLRSRVIDGWRRDEAILPQRLSHSQQKILSVGMARLLAGQVSPSLGTQTELILRMMAGPDLANATGQGWRDLTATLGLVAGRFATERVKPEGRQFLIAQLLAMSPRYWTDPVQAILFASVHYGLQAALHRKRRKPETSQTEAFLDDLTVAVREHLIPAMDKANVCLPDTHPLDLGTASLQEGRDLCGADLAVVAGVRILGRPMYRIILFQAKKAKVTGKADVGEGEGRQLDTILSTGMGWYLFYPAYGEPGTFVPTARSATDVYRDVWGAARPPGFTQVDAYGGEGSPGWDLASFISIAMSSNETLTLGRLFPDLKSAAKALTDNRKHPLAADIVAFDRTGSLKLHDFIDETAAMGYEERRTHHFPSVRDIVPRPAEGDETDDATHVP